jgi:hypothetical protein
MKINLLLLTMLFLFNCASAQKPNVIKQIDLLVEVSEIEKAESFNLGNSILSAENKERDEVVRFLINFANESKDVVSINILTTELRFESLEGNQLKKKFALPIKVSYSNPAIAWLSIFKFNIHLLFDFDIPVAKSDRRILYYIVPRGSKLKSVALGANGGVNYPIIDL